jgi:hypothetical protein
MAETTSTTDALFTGTQEAVQSTYQALLQALHSFGPFQEEPKKTSIHLVRNVGFAGVHPRKSALLLTIRTEQPIQSSRITKTEQVSKHRYHNDMKLTSPGEVNAELIGWLKAAYALG